MEISQIKITNFRGIGSMELKPRHLNVFLGPCGAGKSSVLDAIHFGLTGNISGADIRQGEKTASVMIQFEDGTVIERMRNADGNCVKCNGKRTSIRSANTFLEKRLGADTETYEALCGTDYFETLSPKDLTGLLVSILPVQINMEGILRLVENATTDQSRYLCQFFEDQGDFFGLPEIEQAYNAVFVRRRELKVLIKDLRVRKAFDVSTLPKENKQELEERLYQIAKQEEAASHYHQSVKMYEKSLEAYKKAKARRSQMQLSLKKYDRIGEPDPEVYRKAEEEKEKFTGAINKSYGFISTAKANIQIFQNTLQNLDGSVCPISEKLVCTTDRSSLKEELNLLLEQNRALLQQHEDFVRRCLEQIDKREAVMKAFHEQQISYTEKTILARQLQEFVLPELLDRPKEVKFADRTAEKAYISKAYNTLTAYENAAAAGKELEAKEKELKLAEWALKVLDVKTGIRSKILSTVLGRFEEICNQKAERIRKGFRLKFYCGEGIQVMVRIREDAPYIPMNVVSTGEYVIAAYLLMDIIREIMGAKYLIIDKLDKLDARYMCEFIRLLRDDMGFEHIFLAAVDHMDHIDTLKTLRGTDGSIEIHMLGV